MSAPGGDASGADNGGRSGAAEAGSSSTTGAGDSGSADAGTSASAPPGGADSSRGSNSAGGSSRTAGTGASPSGASGAAGVADGADGADSRRDGASGGVGNHLNGTADAQQQVGAAGSAGGISAAFASLWSGPFSGAEWAAPTVFGTSMRSLGALNFTVPAAASLAIVAAGFLLLLALPAELLQSTIRENYHRLAPIVSPVERAAAAVRRRIPGSTSSWQRQLGLLVGAAVIMSFADPSTGFDLRSMRLVLGLTIVLLLVNYLGVFVTRIHAHAAYRAAGEIVLRPWALALMAVTVVISRFADLQPGIVFGLILGVEIGVGVAGRLRRDGEAKLTVSVTLAMMGLGVGAWLTYSALGMQGQGATTFGNQLLSEVLTGLAVETLTAPVIALIPLTFLDGRIVFTWSKPVWIGLYAVAATVFALVLLPLPSSWVQVPSLLSPWAIAFAAFTLVSVAVWAAFRLVPDGGPGDGDDGPGDGADADHPGHGADAEPPDDNGGAEPPRSSDPQTADAHDSANAPY
ncbi:hypothetical protein LQ955_02230 [Subtercola endophyticus]|nr:hypothetical protein LQ955_02230 [Subtercola endophyticus]